MNFTVLWNSWCFVDKLYKSFSCTSKVRFIWFIYPKSRFFLDSQLFINMTFVL